MTKVHQRVGAFALAILFLATSVGIGIAVIFQVRNQRNAEQSQTQDQATEGKMLQGTKIQNFSPGEGIEKLTYTDEVVGTGEEAKSDSTIIFHYTGALAENGVIFQSSHDGANEATTYPLSQLIPGWQEGIPGMKVGGKRRLFIPWQQGYGEQGSPQGGIPPKADLVFDIELVGLQK